MTNIQTIKDYLTKRISHAESRVKIFKEKYGDDPSEKFTFYGGHTLGYWEGTLSTYQNVLDEIELLELDDN